MKKSVCLLIFAAALSVLTSPARADLYEFDGVTVDVEFWAGLGFGNGDKSAMLVIDFGSASYAFGYTWTGNATGLNMLNAVSSHSPETPPVIFYDTVSDVVTAAGYDGNSHVGDFLTGFWQYYDSANGLSWNLAGPGVTPEGTTLNNLDWDGYAIGANLLLGTDPDTPTTPLAPIPEPATGVLLALGGVVIAARRRFKRG